MTRTTAPDPLVGPLTRFAPAPTGFLHLGHVANAVWVWGTARALGGRVLLCIEDHDRQRCRPAYDETLLEDLDWLGFQADLGPIRQSEEYRPYRDAADGLRAQGLVYGCDCSRSAFAAWAERAGRPWSGPGCPGGCRDRGLDGPCCGWRWAVGRSAGRTGLPGHVLARWLRWATCRSGTGTATGHTASVSSSMTSGKVWIWSSAAGTCSMPPHRRSG